MSCLIIGVLKSTSKIKVHQFLYIFGIHCLEKEGPMYRLVTYVEARQDQSLKTKCSR